MARATGILVLLVLMALCITPNAFAETCSAGEVSDLMSIEVGKNGVDVSYAIPDTEEHKRTRIEYNIFFSPSWQSNEVTVLFGGGGAPLPYLSVGRGANGVVEFRGEKMMAFLSENLGEESEFWIEFQVLGSPETFCSRSQIRKG